MKEVYIIIIYSITHSSRRSIIKEDHHINLPTRRRKNHEVNQVKQQVSYIQFTIQKTRQDLQDVFLNIQVQAITLNTSSH